MWYGAHMKEIVQIGDPVLRAVAAPVTEEQFGAPGLKDVIDGMALALDEQKDGVAIAAPQVGISLRIFLIRYDRLQIAPEGQTVPPNVGVYINPAFVRSSRRRDVMEEGCLSVRGIYGKTYRHERATIRARDFDGKIFERGGGGLLAQVFQHETDHLDGILFVDHALETYEIQKDGEHEKASALPHG